MEKPNANSSSVDKVVPYEPVSIETRVVNSRFIADLAPAKSVEEAREFIASIKKAHPNATHHVPAFLIGFGNSVIAHSSDDREPQGTAGRPALTVLQGSGLGNVVLVITRYFGGTKLGTGGLVRAYTEAAQLAVAKVRRAILVPTATADMQLPYALYDQMIKLTERFPVEILETVFTEEVRLVLEIKESEAEVFCEQVKELSSGKVLPQIVSTDPEKAFLMD